MKPIQRILTHKPLGGGDVGRRKRRKTFFCVVTVQASTAWLCIMVSTETTPYFIP